MLQKSIGRALQMQNEPALQREGPADCETRRESSRADCQLCETAVQGSSSTTDFPQSTSLPLQYYWMFQGSGTTPFYLLFQPVQPQCTQICLQPVYPSPHSIMWTLSFAPTAPSISALCPQESQRLPAQQLPNQPSSAPVMEGGNEAGRKGLRRAKSKRLRNRQKELESAKKNSESNIVNQLFSFFNSYEKSECVVERAIRSLDKAGQQLQKVKSIFYSIVRLINYKRGRKYVNKENILAYYMPAHFIQQVPDINQKLAEVQLLTLQQLCFLFRVTTAHFLRNASINAILTSKRITNPAKHEHLKRRRKVVNALNHSTTHPQP